jgi:hypothetical protein
MRFAIFEVMGKTLRVKSREDFSLFLMIVSNPIRKRILEALSNFPSLPFLLLMSKCHLSHPSHCGVFVYHLRKLIDAGAVAKRKDEYSLTSLGREWTKLTKKMEGEYMKEKTFNKRTEFDMEKLCPMCLEAQLKVNVTPQTIRIKCKNSRCLFGGPMDKPPYYIAIKNEIPDWRKRGLDIYDLVQKSIAKTKATPEEKMKLYRADKCPKCGSESLIVEEFGPWYNKHCRDCDYAWGAVLFTAWELPETVSFLRTHHKVAETFLVEKVTIDGKTCWGTTYTDLDTNEKLILYMDAETFKPIKIIIDFEGKPIAGEMTQEEISNKLLSFEET